MAEIWPLIHNHIFKNIIHLMWVAGPGPAFLGVGNDGMGLLQRALQSELSQATGLSTYLSF